MTMRDLTWVDVEPLDPMNGDLSSVLDSVASLRSAWETIVSSNTESFREARRRALRRHAIETGIIEHLYEVDWGVTEALIAEGITAEVVSQVSTGTLDEDTLETIKSQYDALEFLTDVARNRRQLSVSLIKKIHGALTRTQRTYSAVDSAGKRFEAILHHGLWKGHSNYIVRPDGSKLECTPAEQVQPQMEKLVELYGQNDSIDPIVRSAWLHHRFIRIHPFEDGNGRVARALTLLTLLSNNLAPLVVDRRERVRYITCLDLANEGDLRSLIRLSLIQIPM
jgi:Fic family protein